MLTGQRQSLAFSLIDMAESKAMDLKNSADSLDGTLDTAINSYSGLAL